MTVVYACSIIQLAHLSVVFRSSCSCGPWRLAEDDEAEISLVDSFSVRQTH